MSSNGKRRHSDEEDTPQKKGRTKSKNYQSVYVPFKSMHSSYNCPPDVINKSSVASTSTAFHVNNSGNVDGTRKKETYFIPHDVYKTGYLGTNPVLCIHNVIENLKKIQKEAKLPTSSPKKLDILTTSSYKSATPSTSKQYDDFSSPGPTKNGGDKKVSDLKKLLTKPPHYGRLDALLQEKQKIMIDNDNEHSITKEVNSREKNNMTAEGRPEKPPENVTKTNVMNKQSTKLHQTVTKRNDKAQKQNDYVSAVLHNKELEMIPILNCSNQNTQQHVEPKIETIKNRNTLEADEENDQSAEEKITVNDSQSQLNVGIETNQIELKTELLKDDENQEYHTAYKKFIDTCLKTENSEDMEKIIRIKIKKYYRQCSREYVESPKFLEMVLSAIASIEAEPKHLYKHIKKVVDELDTERMLARSQQTMNKNAASGSETKKSKKIRELQKMLTTLHTNIQAFEQQEVDLDDEESSTFLLAERLKSRFVKVHKMFCKLTNAKLKTEPRITIEPREGVPKGPTKRLQMLINRRVPYGAPFPFPDYHDVLNCVRQANDEDGLGWSNSEIEAEAKYLFEEFGSKLKTRRQLRDREITIVSRITPDCLDPAELDETLRFKLHLNDITAGIRESEVISSFVEKEIQLKQELKSKPSESLGEVEAAVESYEVSVTSDEEAVTFDEVAVISDKVAVASDESAVTSDEVAVTSDKVAVASDEVAVTSDNVAVISDEVAVKSDTVAVTSDEVTVISDEVAVTSDKVAVASDESAVTSDEVTVISDEVAVILSDEDPVTSDEILVISDSD